MVRPAITFIGIRSFVPDFAHMTSSLECPIRRVRVSEQYYRAILKEKLHATLMYTVDEIERMTAQPKYDEMWFSPGVPFYHDETLPSGTAYFELHGQLQ